MRTRRLGRTGIQVSELALGTWGLSGDGYGPVSQADFDAAVRRALALGVTVFETCDAYGRGRAEETLGRVLAEAHDETVVVTRVGVDRECDPPRKRFDAPYLTRALEASRERLMRDPDVVLLHNPAASTLARADVARPLLEARERGRLRAWGVAAGDVEVARAAIELGADVILLAYNLLFDGDLVELTPELEARDVGVLARSVLSHGLLAGMWSSSRMFPPDDHRRDRWTQAELGTRLHHANAARCLIDERVHTLRSASLRFVLENPLVSSAVLGPRTVTHVEQLVRESRGGPPYLDPDRLARLPSRLAEVGAL
ncbi:MAG: aldo/keto reductase [Polyangiaceae bacterium]|nr:aldo/keto reductase [Polyangiaceae bacterium]